MCWDFTQNQNIFFPVINLCRWAHVYSKNYYISASSKTRRWKTSVSIKSNSISRIFVLIDISIFSQTNCSKLTVFQCRIIADVDDFTYLINNVNVYYFSMIKCNTILFQKASIKFYSCFSTIITEVWSNTMIRRFTRINIFVKK